MVEEIQKKLQNEIDKFKQVQKDYHKALSKRQQLDSQLNENTVVEEELNLLKAGNEVYKLIGPVLIRQELIEARENVSKRKEFISAEMKHTEHLITTLDHKQEMYRENLDKLQKSFQQAQIRSNINN